MTLPALPFAGDRLRTPFSAGASPARVAIAMIGFAVVMLLIVEMVNVISPRAELPQQTEYPKKSPFTAVRWQKSQPEVRHDKQWFKLVSLNDLPAVEIVAFSQRTEGKNGRNDSKKTLLSF